MKKIKEVLISYGGTCSNGNNYQCVLNVGLSCTGSCR